jgi:hypothetical protein
VSVNRYKPHLLILPEDDANRQIAVGFATAVDEACSRQLQILEVAGGWLAAVNRFLSDHVRYMQDYPDRHMLLLIDFDGDPARLQTVRGQIPSTLAARVFVLGALTEPEDLRRQGLGTYEQIGRTIATECFSEEGGLWSHTLLSHNLEEVARLRPLLRVLGSDT